MIAKPNNVWILFQILIGILQTLLTTFYEQAEVIMFQILIGILQTLKM